MSLSLKKLRGFDVKKVKNKIKNKMTRITLLISLLLISFSAFSNNPEGDKTKGFIRGNIADGDFGGPLIGAAVTVEEMPGVGTITDFDGNFSLPLPPGSYTIKVSFISYAPVVFPQTEIKLGESTVVDATLKASTATLKAVVITAKASRNNETAILMDMKKATNVTDGISSQSFRKIGDANLGSAMKRVTGVTVQDGKYVYVRGLGDRYTKTTLNGMAIPGLDPDVNSIQIDIFPTSVLENVAVYKTFSPDLYGDFTGGMIDVVTKKFPLEKTTNLSFGTTFTPGMHFNSDYVYYDGNSADALGFAGKDRELPFFRNAKIPDEVLADPELENITRSFSNQLGIKNKIALPNGSFSFNHGNQLNLDNGGTIGYNAVANYSTARTFYEGFESNFYLKSTSKNENNLNEFVTIKGNLGKNSVMWSGLASGSYKKGSNVFVLSILNTQSGESTAAKRVNKDHEQTGAILAEDILTYSARTLTSGILSGNHKVNNTNISWSNALSFSKVYDPDFRETKISMTDGVVSLNTGDGAGINRFWRYLNEYNESFKFDVKHQLNDNMSIKTGGFAMFKHRDFEIVNFKLDNNGSGAISTDPNWFLADENIWSSDKESPNFRNGTYTIGSYQPANSYSADQTQLAGYLMAENRFLGLFKAVYGVRVEKTDLYYTGTNNSGSETYNRTKTLDAFNFLPSLNFVYSVNEDMNLRLAANKTVAMPSFKEKSIAQIYDPITKRTFIGNLDLEQTKIMNFDVRYEYFISPKELFSVAGFYKQFDGHIELISNNLNPDEVKPRNSGDAMVYGIEVELRKGLPEAENFLNRLFFTTNVSLVNSAIDMNSVYVNNDGKTEFQSREGFLRDGETIANTRQMSGQSPYAVNVALSYDEPATKLSFSLAYNVQGDQLTIIGSERVPDIYTRSFNSFNFNSYKSFGKDFNSKITFGVTNILNDSREMVYHSFGSDDKIFNKYNPGVGFNFKYSFTF